MATTEIIEVTKNGSTVVEVIERGPAGPVGPQGLEGFDDAPEDGIIYGRKDAEWIDMTSPANLQVRRGTAAEVAAITPLEGEPVWATDTKVLYLGDATTTGGIAVGGFPLRGDVANGFTPGKIRAADSANGVGSQSGTTKVLGNTRGTGSVDLQMERTNASNVASGNYAFIGGGINNRASNTYSTVLNGNNAQATGGSAIAAGSNSLASGSSSIALQGGIASGSNSFALGASSEASSDYCIAIGGAKADRTGMLSINAQPVTGFTGRAQAVQFAMRARTTNATPTEMLLQQLSFVNLRLNIPQNVALFGTIQICCIEPTTATESAHFFRKFAIQNLNGSPTLIGSVTTVGTDHKSVAGYDVTITAGSEAPPGQGRHLKIEVTGDSSKTLHWVAVIQGVEIAIA
jgi:hypothetical protein